MSNLQSKFEDLERKMRSLAAENGDIYLPNVVPPEAVHYVFICMEPSFAGWAGKDGAQSQSRLDAGIRNFLWSMDDFIFHYSIQHYLLKPGQWYHVTDVSKGAMTVDKAQVERESRYREWYSLLREELELLARRDANYFVVGRSVENFLTEFGFPYPIHRILHFSGQAATSRKKSVDGHEAEFAEFRDNFSTDDVLSTALRLLIGTGMSDALCDEILQRLQRSGPISESRKMLAFHYKQHFNQFRNAQMSSI